MVRLRDKAGIGEDIGVLRVFDVIAWMRQGRRAARNTTRASRSTGLRTNG
ncbi:DUF6308 family protein [Streptomyces sp. NPDC048577]